MAKKTLDLSIFSYAVNVFMNNSKKIVTAILLWLSFGTSALYAEEASLTGPSYSSSGTFTVSWNDFPFPTNNCWQFELDINGFYYWETIDIQNTYARSYTFHDVPNDGYYLELWMRCSGPEVNPGLYYKDSDSESDIYFIDWHDVYVQE